MIPENSFSTVGIYLWWFVLCRGKFDFFSSLIPRNWINFIFSLILGCWLFAFPESPKFHYEIGETDKALHILQHIYSVNTRDAPENFPVKTLKGSEKSESEQRLYGDRTVRQLRIRRPRELALLLKEIWNQIKNLCKKPHLRNTALTCFIQFGLTTRFVSGLNVCKWNFMDFSFSYYTLMLWFPELMQRYEHFEEEHPGEQASVCDINVNTSSTQWVFFKKIYFLTNIFCISKPDVFLAK